MNLKKSGREIRMKSWWRMHRRENSGIALPTSVFQKHPSAFLLILISTSQIQFILPAADSLDGNSDITSI